MNKESLSKKTFWGVFWKFAERSLAYIVSASVAIILARILTPEDYAAVSVVTIFFNFCNLFISNGLTSALIQKRDSDTIDYSTILYSNIFISICLYIILFFTSPSIGNLYNQPMLSPIVRVMGISLFVNSLKSVICAKISNDLCFRKFFVATLSGTIISAFVGIIMALKGYGAWALVCQQISNSVIDTIILLIVSDIRIILVFSASRFKQLFKFGIYILLSGIINRLYEEIRPLIIGIKFSTVDLAFYNKGLQYPNLINSSINETLISVLFPVMSKAQDDLVVVLAMTRKFMKVCSFIVFPIMLGLFAVSENLVIILLTEKWIPIVPYVKIFSIVNMFAIIQDSNLLPIRAIGRSDVILKVDIIKKMLYFLILVVFIVFSTTPHALAAMGILVSFVAYAINSFAGQKYIHYKLKMQLMDIFDNLVPAIIMCVLVSLANRLSIPPLVLLPVQITLGIISYCIVSIILKNESYSYLLKIIIDNINFLKQKKYV